MKKILCLTVLSVLVLTSVKASDKVKYGVVAGLNVSKFNAPLMNSKVGFHVGGKSEIDLSNSLKNVYLDIEALLSMKGSQIGLGDFGSSSYNPFYLDIPIHIGYKYPINEKFSVFGNFGPYFGFGLFGKASLKSIDEAGNNISESRNVFGKDGLKRFDFGLGLKIGAEIDKKYQLSLGYDWGLLNNYKRSDVSEEDVISPMKNRNFYVSLAYLF